MGFTTTSYFVILTLSLTHFLVERVSSTNTVDFFFLALVGFFSIVVLSLATVLSSSMAGLTNTYKFFWLIHLGNALVMPLASCSEPGNPCFVYRYSSAIYEEAEPFSL
jgi:hypothetical protein